MPTVYACEFLVAFIWCLWKKYESFKRLCVRVEESFLVEKKGDNMLSLSTSSACFVCVGEREILYRGCRGGKVCSLSLSPARFDSELSSAKDDAATERQEKAKLAHGRHTLRSDLEELQEKLKETQEELDKSNQEKEDLKSELLEQTSASTESEVTSLKKMKRELESKLEVMEDDLDEANIK